MKLWHYLTIWTLLALSLTVISAVGHAATPMYFKHGCWLCTSPEAYNLATEALRNLKAGTFDELKKELFESKKCIYIEDDQVTDVVSPYISVLESIGDMRNISFVLKMERREAFLHRHLTWYTFKGWTDVANLKELW